MKIDHTSPHANNAELANVTFDAYGAAAIYRLMQQLGAGKDTELHLIDGKLRVVSRFRYTTAIIPDEKDASDGWRQGTQHETIDAWIRKRAKAHRLNVRKMSKVQSAMAQTLAAMDWLKRELHGDEK